MSSIRRTARDTAADIAQKGAIEWLARTAARLSSRVDRGAPQVLDIITYHRVAPVGADPGLAPTLLSTTPEGLDHQLRTIRALTTPVTLRQVRGAVERGETLPPRPVLVTFDDAYRSFADHAWPVLRRHGVPATMFVATSYPDRDSGGYWWDEVWAALSTGDPAVARRLLGDAGVDVSGVPVGQELALFKRARDHLRERPAEELGGLVDRLVERCGGARLRSTVMSWDQLQDLAGEGLEIGAHTHTHPLLTTLPFADAREEIRRSIDELDRRGFPDATVFAYPGGGHDDRVREAADAAGCTIAMTTERGTNRLPVTDALRLRRINVGRSTSPAVLAAELVPTLARSRRWAR